MGYERGMSAIRLEGPDEIPHTQYITHPAWLEHLRRARGRADAAFEELLDFDFRWSTDGPNIERGRWTDMGHAVWQADAGAQGFIFEPTTDLQYICSRYGKTHVIIGNADCRVLTFGTADEVRAEVKRCMNLGRDCPGYFFAVGNHIPPNVPIENADACIEAYRDLRRR